MFTSDWRRRDWVASILMICIVLGAVWAERLTIVKSILHSKSSAAKAARIIAVLLFIVIFASLGFFVDKTSYVVSFFILGWAVITFVVLPRTTLWIEVNGTVRVRRIIAGKSYTWNDIECIAFADSQTKAGVSILKVPIVKHRYLEMTFRDGVTARLKINRDDVMTVRSSIERNGAIHLISEKKAHGEEEFEYPI
jgi:hypothetical protein